MEIAEQFSLRMKDFDDKVSSFWKQLKKDKEFSDVTLCCDDQLFNVHRVIVSSISPVFRNILRQTSAQNPVIYLFGVKCKNMANLINFIYQGEVSLEKEELNAFLSLTTQLKIEGLPEENKIHHIENQMMQHQENVLCPPKKKKLLEHEQNKLGNEKINKYIKLRGTVEENDNNDLVISNNDQYLDDSIKKESKIVESNLTINKEEHIALINSCEVCDFTSVHKSSMKNHMRSEHEGVRYSCGQCDYKAKQMGHLKRHMESQHENFICDRCNYQAISKHKLKLHKYKNHMKSDSGETLYFCEDCDYVSTWKSAIKTHTESKHKGIDYACDVCNYKTNWRMSLKSHIESKHAGILYSCDSCDFKVAQKTNLQKHIKLNHSDNLIN